MDKAAIPDSTDLDPTALVQQYQVGLWRYMRALGCDAALAEDLVQDTFVSVLRHDVKDYGPAALGAYLRKVARNLFISRQRRERRMSVVEDLEEFDQCWINWVGDDRGDELIDALRQCLQRLTTRARDALEMRFRDRMSRSRIAEQLDITEHGAKNLMQRAKKQLKGCIETKVQ